MRMRNKAGAAFTFLEAIVVTGIVSFAVVGSLKVLVATRQLNDRAETLTALALRAQVEIEARKAIPFAKLEAGTTAAAGTDDPRTSGTVTIAPVPDSPAVRIEVEMAGRTSRGRESIRLAALRYPEVER